MVQFVLTLHRECYDTLCCDTYLTQCTPICSCLDLDLVQEVSSELGLSPKSTDTKYTRLEVEIWCC